MALQRQTRAREGQLPPIFPITLPFFPQRCQLFQVFSIVAATVRQVVQGTASYSSWATHKPTIFGEDGLVFIY